MIRPISPVLFARLKKIGMQTPVRTVNAAKDAGVNLALFCSLLMQESGGGRQVWGHDPTIFTGGYDARNRKQWGENVTQAAYTEYKRQRGPRGSGGMQGVGDCQLTWFSYQDAADALGGCWRHYPNQLVGAKLLAALIRRNGLRSGVAAFNGSGPSAEAYANTVLARASSYARSLGTPAP